MRRRLIVFFALTVLACPTACSDDPAPVEPADVGVDDTGELDADEPDADQPDADEDVDEDVDADATGCALEFDDIGDARLFTFASKIRVEDAVSYETYDAYFRGQVEAIEECLSDTRPNLLLFPENAGLHAGLIGSRGANARQATTADGAFGSLFLAYADSVGWVDEQFDDLELSRRIFLGLTDTVWRAVDRTFSGIADDYDVWVLTSANVAEVQQTSDPDLVEVWADPDLEDVSSVFIPAGEEVFNTAIIYGPDGELVSRVHKPFLTATEETELALSYGALSGLRPVDVGPKRFGVVTSKDAWMPPVNDRLGLLGADVQVQPEAFSGWTTTQLEDQQEWLPDVLTQSGWAAVQKYPSFQYGAMPVLTGNFMGMVFDGQAVIWGQAHPGVEFGGFVGQDDRPGFLEVSPWAFPDPVEDDPNLSLEERRELLRTLGEKLAPGAGEPHENAYYDGVVARDLKATLDYDADPDAGPDPTIGDSMPVGDPSEVAQRVRLAADAGQLAMVWQQGANPSSKQLSRYEWSDGDYAPTANDALSGESPYVAPAVTFAGAGDLVTAFQVVGDDTSILQVRRHHDGGVDDVDLPWADQFEDVWLPALASDGDTVALAFSASQTGQDRIYVALSGDGGQSFAEPVAVDGPPEFDPPNTRGIQWHPTVDVHGDTIAVAWTDFRAFQWDLFGTYSLDAGETWATAQRLDDAGDGQERLHTDPRLVLVDDGEALLAWTYQADRRPDTDARYLRWSFADAEPPQSTVLSRDGDDYPAQGWLPVVVPVGEDIAAAWMELDGDTATIELLLPGAQESITASNPTFPAWAPDLVMVDDRLVLTWIEHRPDEGFSVRMTHVDGALP